MFASPAEILKAPEGTLAETPLPLLLHALLLEERTCTIALKSKGIEKHVMVEEGSPAACKSNLLHETLGRFLVERGKLSDEQYNMLFAESARTNAAMGDMLVAKGLISASDLYKQMQANLARKILDCFRWPDAKYTLHPGAELDQTAVKMNPVQLILTGVATFLPFDVVASNLVFTDEQAFGAVTKPPHELSELKLSPKDAKLFNALRQRPNFTQLSERMGMETEDLFRKLYAFCVLGLVDFADAPAVAAPKPVSAPAFVAAPPPPVSAPPPPISATPSSAVVEEMPEFKDQLSKAFLEHRGKDPFALLGVNEDVPAGALRKSFLVLADKFSPLRCSSSDSREKAETLLVAYARAYGSLADPDQLQLWRKRRQASREAAAAPPKKTAAAEVFKISTTLLDARSQFAEAKKRLDAGNVRGAMEYFEYACDIEPKALYRAHLAWTRFLVSPVHAKLAVSELNDVVKADPECEPAFFFLAEIHKAQKTYDLAEDAYRKAFKVNPNNRKAMELAQEMAKLRKR